MRRILNMSQNGYIKSPINLPPRLLYRFLPQILLDKSKEDLRIYLKLKK